MRLLCLDPGGCTGYAIFTLSDTDPLTLVEYGQIERGLEGFLDWWESRTPGEFDVVVAENFILDQRREVSPELVGLRILGALKVLFPGFLSPRNQMMKHAPDPFLRKHGLYVNGMKHARDAIRHGVAWAKVTKRHRPTIEKFWPRKR